MKYFAIKYNDRHGYLLDADVQETHEITRRYARTLYEQSFKKGELNLKAIPKFNKGERVAGSMFAIWGENISNRELFKRRLNGTVAQKVIDK